MQASREPDDPSGNVRYDVGGWISGPCLDWPMASDDGVTKESIEQEFSGWEAWQGVDRRWHARNRGATPPVMIHGEDLVDLRDEIKRKVGQVEEERWRSRQ